MMKYIATLLCLVFAACSQGEKTTLTHPNGMRQAEGYMNEIGKNGLWTFWNEQGQLTQQGDFEDGLKVGVWTYWNDEGKKERDGEIKDGEWTYWFSWRISANENAAVATLRSIAAAQQQFQASSSVDTDYDGVGEFGYFGEMAGTTNLRIGSSASDVSGTLDPPYLPIYFGNITASLVERQGYNYQIFLPDSTGAGVTEALGALGTSLSPADSSDCEVMWCCYAWPVDAGKTGMRAFFINQEGDIISQNNRVVIGQYSGTAGPAWSAAYDEENMGSALGLVDNTTNTVTATDARVWNPVGN